MLFRKDKPQAHPQPDHSLVEAHINEIEMEMKRIGFWQSQPLEPEKYNFSRAFAMDTMSFDQWLQFIFIPRVRSIIASRGTFPASSSVGAQAVREFDGSDTQIRLSTCFANLTGYSDPRTFSEVSSWFSCVEFPRCCGG